MEPRPFVYRDFGTLATIARFRAVVDLGWLRLTGAPAWFFWLVVHLTFLTGFKNRLAAHTNGRSRFSVDIAGSEPSRSSRSSLGVPSRLGGSVVIGERSH